ncbi:MAG: SAM domain-containing protein [Hyphomicrobiaceae bacterium]
MDQDIADWLKRLGLSRYTSAFIENEIELIDLQWLEEGDLEKLGLPMGPRKRILNAAIGIGKDGGISTTASAEAN